MNIIVVRDVRNKPLRFNISPAVLVSCVISALVGLSILVGAVAFKAGDAYGSGTRLASNQLQTLNSELGLQARKVNEIKAASERELNALALRLGDLQARSTRLEALGERLTQVGQLDDGEFRFSEPPAIGGPEEPTLLAGLERPDLMRQIAELEQTVDRQFRDLNVLERLISDQELDQALQPSGRPVAKGWMSSAYGKRADPFTGKPTMHYGVDFSGAPGSDILAVAGGMVTWSGRRSGYGNLVEIDHGNGYLTRYAHNQENTVEVGQRVRADDVIALMGATGRATSSHVHFEVWRDGRRMNPMSLVASMRD